MRRMDAWIMIVGCKSFQRMNRKHAEKQAHCMSRMERILCIHEGGGTVAPVQPPGHVTALSPTTAGESVTGATAIDGKDLLARRLKEIQQHFRGKGENIGSSKNDGGDQFGNAVVITWDKKNFKFYRATKHLKKSQWENARGYVIRTTSLLVDIVTGNPFGKMEELRLLQKHNHNVAKK